MGKSTIDEEMVSVVDGEITSSNMKHKYKQKLKELRSMVRELQQTRNSNEAVIQQLQTELLRDSRQEENETLKKELAVAREHWAGWAKHAQTLQEQNDTLRIQVEELKNTVRQKKSKINLAIDKYERYKKKKNELEAKLRDCIASCQMNQPQQSTKQQADTAQEEPTPPALLPAHIILPSPVSSTVGTISAEEKNDTFELLKKKTPTTLEKAQRRAPSEAQAQARTTKEAIMELSDYHEEEEEEESLVAPVPKPVVDTKIPGFRLQESPADAWRKRKEQQEEKERAKESGGNRKKKIKIKSQKDPWADRWKKNKKAQQAQASEFEQRVQILGHCYEEYIVEAQGSVQVGAGTKVTVNGIEYSGRKALEIAHAQKQARLEEERKEQEEEEERQRQIEEERRREEERIREIKKKLDDEERRIKTEQRAREIAEREAKEAAERARRKEAEEEKKKAEAERARKAEEENKRAKEEEEEESAKKKAEEEERLAKEKAEKEAAPLVASPPAPSSTRRSRGFLDDTDSDSDDSDSDYDTDSDYSYQKICNNREMDSLAS